MELPGSDGEHEAQERFGSAHRALAFYDAQMLTELNAAMREFIGRQEMAFIATADSGGECDCSLRAGPPGFVQVLDARTLAYPEYRGNGVMASVGNLLENANVGMIFVDFFVSTVGLHVNGTARVVENEEMLALAGSSAEIVSALGQKSGRQPERWVVVSIKEAYIHCSKHVPLLQKLDKKIHWGTDEMRHKGGDFFGAAKR